jgi:hypothetical protein
VLTVVGRIVPARNDGIDLLHRAVVWRHRGIRVVAAATAAAAAAAAVIAAACHEQGS